MTEGYEFDLSDFVLSHQKVSEVFIISDKKVDLRKDTFSDVLCSEFGKKIGCPIILKHKNVLQQTITFYSSCMINREKKYKLTCNRDEIKKNCHLKFSVVSTTKKNCNHKGLMEGRNLSGKERDNARQKALKQTPSQV